MYILVTISADPRRKASLGVRKWAYPRHIRMQTSQDPLWRVQAADCGAGLGDELFWDIVYTRITRMRPVRETTL